MLGAHNNLTALKQADFKTQKILKNRERFFARMSHEIRTPLHGMMGVAELLKNKNVDDSIKDQLSTILNCGRQLQHLLNDLLTLSKIDDDKFSVHIEDVSISSLFEFIDSLFKASAQAKSLLFEMPNYDISDVFGRSDEIRLTQIISNIVSNAIKFTNDGRNGLGFRNC